MRPSLYPKKHSPYPNKEAYQTVEKLHESRMGKGKSKKTLYVLIILTISSIIIAFLTPLPIVIGVILILAAVSLSLIKTTDEQNHTATRTSKMEDRVNLNYGNEYDKEQLKENLIILEEKFRNGQIGEADYRTTKEKYQSMLYEYEHVKVEANSFKVSPKYEYNSRTPEKKSSGVAAIASFFIPGLGQIYNGQILKGILFIIFCGISVVVGIILVLGGAFTANSTAILIGIVLYPIFWAYNIHDAYKTAERTHL